MAKKLTKGIFGLIQFVIIIVLVIVAWSFIGGKRGILDFVGQAQGFSDDVKSSLDRETDFETAFAEEGRAQAELTRAEAELARIDPESERAQAERDRANAEIVRAQADLEAAIALRKEAEANQVRAHNETPREESKTPKTSGTSATSNTRTTKTQSSSSILDRLRKSAIEEGQKARTAIEKAKQGVNSGFIILNGQAYSTKYFTEEQIRKAHEAGKAASSTKKNSSSTNKRASKSTAFSSSTASKPLVNQQGLTFTIPTPTRGTSRFSKKKQ